MHHTWNEFHEAQKLQVYKVLFSLFSQQTYCFLLSLSASTHSPRSTGGKIKSLHIQLCHHGSVISLVLILHALWYPLPATDSQIISSEKLNTLILYFLSDFIPVYQMCQAAWCETGIWKWCPSGKNRLQQRNTNPRSITMMSWRMGSQSLIALKRPFVGTDFHGHISGFNFWKKSKIESTGSSWQN